MQVDKPQHISILVPTRARTTFLQGLFNSLEETTRDKHLVDVWIYVDNDDEVTQQFFASGASDAYSFKVNLVIGERTKTQGEMANILWEKCTTKADIYLPLPDDYVFATRHWDDRIREVFDRYPDRVLLVYPDEATARPNQVTIAILSSEWISAVGRLFTTYFPFWYDDTWLDQVAQMVQRKEKVQLNANPQGNKGKTIRMRNVLFWGCFFRHTMDERIADAERLRKAIYPVGSAAYDVSARHGARLAAEFTAQLEKVDFEMVAYIERHFAGDAAKSKPSARYLAVETDAVRHLFCKAVQQWQQDRFQDALAILSDIRYASQRFTSIEYARALCLLNLGRRAEARQAILAEMEAQPGDPQARALCDAIDNSEGYMLSRYDSARIADLPIIPLGENPAAFPKLSALSEIRIRFMPVTLRVGVLWSVLSSYPPREWPAQFADLARRFRRRRTQ